MQYLIFCLWSPANPDFLCNLGRELGTSEERIWGSVFLGMV